jgi:hypothetical protein
MSIVRVVCVNIKILTHCSYGLFSLFDHGSSSTLSREVPFRTMKQFDIAATKISEPINCQQWLCPGKRAFDGQVPSGHIHCALPVLKDAKRLVFGLTKRKWQVVDRSAMTQDIGREIIETWKHLTPQFLATMHVVK